MNNFSDVIQEWSGYIISINKEEKTFESILEDITAGGTNETICLSFSFVDDKEICLIEEGAIFNLKIIREVVDNMSMVKPTIKFLQPIELSKSQLDKIEKYATDMAKKFGWE